VTGAEEPTLEAGPALAAGFQVAGLSLGHLLGIAGGRIARLALGHQPQEVVEAGCEGKDVPGDGIGAAHQVADKALQIVDQPAFVDDHLGGAALLQLDAARHPGHECLSVVGQALEHAH
jgi:hypothetical protein